MMMYTGNHTHNTLRAMFLVILMLAGDLAASDEESVHTVVDSSVAI